MRRTARPVLYARQLSQIAAAEIRAVISAESKKSMALSGRSDRIRLSHRSLDAQRASTIKAGVAAKRTASLRAALRASSFWAASQFLGQESVGGDDQLDPAAQRADAAGHRVAVDSCEGVTGLRRRLNVDPKRPGEAHRAVGIGLRGDQECGDPVGH